MAQPGKKFFLILIFLCIYLIGASIQAFNVNTDMTKADQLDYIQRATDLNITHYERITDGNRMPLYPFILSFLYHPGISHGEYFRRGKILSIILSVTLLIILFLIFRIYLNALESQVLILITAFTLFMPRAGYIQSELLFYFLNFCAFLLFWGCLKTPRLWIAAAAGLLAGLTYLTKSSVVPAVVWFIFFYIIIHIAVPIIKKIVNKIKPKMSLPQCHILKNIVALLVFIVIFLLTVYPYISVNKQVFGHYFYNVNSTFYIWCDSWEQAKVGRDHGDRVGWPKMPPEELPSGGKYLHEHSLSQILVRLASGFVIVIGNAIGGFGYAQYLCIYLLICILAITKQYGAFVEYLKLGNNYLIVISLILYFLLYFLLYAFGATIFKGPRHPLAQYLPAMFLMSYFLSKLEFNYYSQAMSCQFDLRKINIIVIGLLGLELIFNMPYKIFAVFNGY
ncbi:MAG: hypothetical protein ACHQ2F_00915 [Desulfobaccales bacterium]